MSRSRPNRRHFLQTSAGVIAASAAPYYFTSKTQGDEPKSDRRVLGAIGCGGQGRGIMNRARQFADIVAVCDVDRTHAEQAKREGGDKPEIEIFEDYRKLLDRKDIDVVTIGTPDHWHTAVCIAALEAGKDVYCEKPLTLTVDEGKLLVKKVKETGRVVQVGTHQRSDRGTFARAVATVRSGQLGKIQKVTVQLPLSTSEGGPFAAKPVPEGMNWGFWLGQAPKVDYMPERCHFQFRWWYEYSGGIVTDWGAHHMDVAQWGLNVDNAGPLTIDGTQTKLPSIENGYNTPKYPVITYTYPGDVQVQLVTGNEGVMFEGEKGRIFVNRGRVTGKAIEDQDADRNLRESIEKAVVELYRGNVVGDHMGNFFESIKTKGEKPPVSDIVSQHRSVSACHLGNISIRLGRKLEWDAEKEDFKGDSQASSMLSREQREPYKVVG